MKEGWTFVKTLEYELGLDTDTAERVEQLVADSEVFFTTREWNEREEKHDTELARLEGDLEEAYGIIADIRKLVT